MIIGALDTSGTVIGFTHQHVLYLVVSKGGHSHFRLQMGDGSGFVFACFCSAKGPALLGHASELATRSKILGVTKVVCRRGPSTIASLPVEDVENHVGDIEGLGKIVWCKRERAT